MRKRYTIPRNGRGWPVRARVDPSLQGPKAWEHPAAVEWRRWAREELEARSGTVLLTPCSNVKPYPRSPASAKVRGVLRRLGLWDPGGPGLYGSPRGLEWLYLSDLLGLVPYERAHEYPACCYEFPPHAIDGSLALVVGEIRSVLEGFLRRNRDRVRVVVAYLPRFYRRLAEPVLQEVLGEEGVVWARYHLFHGHRSLESVLREVRVGR